MGQRIEGPLHFFSVLLAREAERFVHRLLDRVRTETGPRRLEGRIVDVDKSLAHNINIYQAVMNIYNPTLDIMVS